MTAFPNLPPAPVIRGVTRDGLIDGSMIAALRAHAPAGTTILSDAELDASLAASLTGHPPEDDVYVFGYGSLMWNPAMHFVEKSTASVHGWSRRFCIWMHFARGTPEQPGLMLALDRGGACKGVVLRIAAAVARHELGLLWRREMLTGVYEARWVSAVLEGRTVRALTFVVNRKHLRYSSGLSTHQIADFVSTGAGSLGTSLAYFDATLEALEALKIRDAGIERLRRAIRGRQSPESVMSAVAR